MPTIKESEIKILFNDGSLKDITQASDNLNISALARPVKKYYLLHLTFDLLRDSNHNVNFTYY